jgi:Ca2+-binding RTX toxin-like protein
MKTSPRQCKDASADTTVSEHRKPTYPGAALGAVAIAALVSGSTLTGPSPAEPASSTQTSTTVGISGGALNVNAAPGAANRITISQGGKSFIVRDAGGSLSAGTACTFIRILRVVECPSTGVSKVSVHLGDKDDTLSVNFSGPVEAFGGDGNDALTTGSGNDILDGGLGADRISGGDGKDTIDYRTRAKPVVVRLDGSATSGEQGELDTVSANVENIEGGSAGDTLTGNDRNNRIRGYGGNDDVHGQAGRDSLTGGDGNDQIDGGPNDDRLAGSNGNDIVTGGPGSDVIQGNNGNDILNGRDGVQKNDTLNGGNQIDTCVADLLDAKTACEN